MSSNGDCCVIECTHPRVLLRWQARYSAPALTATTLLTRAIFGVWFFTVKQGIKSRYLAVLRYADSLALRPTSRARAPNSRAHYRLGSRALRRRVAVLAAHAVTDRLAGASPWGAVARAVRAQNTQSRRHISSARWTAGTNPHRRRMCGQRGFHL